MELKTLQDAHVQTRRIYNKLNEVLDLSQQLAQAIDRNDQVSIQMLLAMRGDPIQSVMQSRAVLEQQLQALEASAPADAKRLRELLNGGAARKDEEAGLVSQVAANDRLLKRIQELDKILNQKLTRDKSFYGT